MENKDFLILVPARHEIGPLVRCFKLRLLAHPNFSVYEGEIAEHSVTVVEAGFDQKFQKNIQQILNEFSGRKILLFGTAGALNPIFQFGQVFLVNKIFGENERTFLEVSVPENLTNFPKTASVTGHHFADEKLKKKLALVFPEAGLYEQENFSFASACREKNKTFLILRTVSDEFKTHLPSTFLIFRHFQKFNWKYRRDFLKNLADFIRLIKFKINFIKSIKMALPELEKIIKQW